MGVPTQENPMNELMTRRTALRRLTGLSLSLAGLSLAGLATAAPADPNPATLDRLAREARRCEQLCAACTRHCAAMVKMGMTEHRRTLAVSRDCGEICGLTAKLADRRSPDIAAMAHACAEACGLCARECGRYADMKIMTVCAHQSQVCATACRAVYAPAKG